MNHRFPVFAAAAAAGIAMLPGMAVHAAAQALPVAAKPAPTAKTYTAPRLADGHPDLQGVFTNATVTPLERPKDLGTKAFFTPEEAAAYKKRQLGRKAPAGKGTYTDVHYSLDQYGLGRYQSPVAGNLRTSLVTDPPDGRIPLMLPEARQRNAERAAKLKGHEFDSAQNRSLAERCLMWPNEGPPMLPEGYNSDLQISQGPGYVAITQEMIHDVRIIPTDGRPHLPASVRQWFGDSRGHWEGDTLVVDTTNFTDKTRFHGSDENLHVVERFTRVDPKTVLYQFTVSDPTTWARSWSGEIPMTKAEGPLYEYACAEGNYGMANNLSGARAVEKKAAGQ